MIEQLQFQYLFLNQNLFVYDFIIIILIPTIYMFKQFLCVLLLLSLTRSITDRQIIQQTLNGIFEQNKLADPTTITDCDYGDDDVDHQIVVFIQTQLDKCANGNFSDLVSLIYGEGFKNFVNSLPLSVVDCICANDEADELAVAYNLKGVDRAAIERKVLAYVTLHYIVVHKWIVQLNDLWNAGNYYQTGFNGAGYAHQMLGTILAKYIKQMRQRRY